MSSKYKFIDREDVLKQFFEKSSIIEIKNKEILKKFIDDYSKSFDSQALIDTEDEFVKESIDNDFECNYRFIPLREFGDNGKIVGYYKLFWVNYNETIKYYKFNEFEKVIFHDPKIIFSDVEKGVINVFLRDLEEFSVFSSKARYNLIKIKKETDKISDPRVLLPYYFMLFKHEDVVTKIDENGELTEAVPKLFDTLKLAFSNELFTTLASSKE